MPVYPHEEYLAVLKILPDFVEYDANGIPFIEPDEVDISQINNGLWLINYKNVSSQKKNASRKIVHFFCYDGKIRSILDHPVRLIKKVSGYYAVATPDFTMDPKMKIEPIRMATFNNRWIGAFLQTNGIRVIPTVGWVDDDTYDICFGGLRDGGTFLISSYGVNNPICQDGFFRGYREMRKRYPNTKIICAGDRIDGMDSDVCFVKYEETFGNWDQYQKTWQPSMINWDGSIPESEVKIEL